MKKQSIFILLSFILSSCASSQHPAPIEYNNSRSKKTYTTKTNPTISDDGEVISRGVVEVRENEIITPNNNEEEKSVDNSHNLMSVKSKIIYHEVQVGETIEEISDKYGVKVSEIAALNGLLEPYYLDEFQILKIKQIDALKFSQDQKLPRNDSLQNDNLENDRSADTKLVSVPRQIQSPREKIKEVKIEKHDDKIKNKAILAPTVTPHARKDVAEYIMPLKGKIIAKFGDKTDLGASKGVSIGAKLGSDVRAAASGKVIYADYDATYGNLVIVKLDGKNIVTSYAHLEDITKKKGDDVAQGEVLGHVGSSGKVKEPQLNFGIREGKIAKDPAKFLKY